LIHSVSFHTPLQSRILRIEPAGIVDRAGGADIPAAGIGDRHDLERIDVDMEGMADEAGLQRPFVDAAEPEYAVDPVRVVWLRFELRWIEMLRIDRLVADLEGDTRIGDIDEEHQLLLSGDLAVGNIGCGTKLENFSPSRRSAATWPRTLGASVWVATLASRFCRKSLVLPMVGPGATWTTPSNCREAAAGSRCPRAAPTR